MAKPLPEAKLSIEACLVRAELARRGLRIRDLAAMAGLSPEHTTNVLVGNSKSLRARTLLEHALGLRIWTMPGEFKARGSRGAMLDFGSDLGISDEKRQPK